MVHSLFHFGILFLLFVITDILFAVCFVSFFVVFCIAHLFISFLFLAVVCVSFAKPLGYGLVQLLRCTQKFLVRYFLLGNQFLYIFLAFLSILILLKFAQAESQEIPCLHTLVFFLYYAIENFYRLFEFLELKKQTACVHTKIYRRQLNHRRLRSCCP